MPVGQAAGARDMGPETAVSTQKEQLHAAASSNPVLANKKGILSMLYKVCPDV